MALIDPENRTALFEALFVLGVLVGVFQILIAVFKLGDLTRSISESVIIGFMLAAALLLGIGQIGNTIGVKDKGNAHMQVLHRLHLTLFHGDAINFRTLFLSVTAVVVADVLRMLVRRFGRPQIDLLAVLVVAGLIAFTAGWSIPGADGKSAEANLYSRGVATGLPAIADATADPLSCSRVYLAANLKVRRHNAIRLSQGPPTSH